LALADSLLSAIVRADGDALVMHVGERPYVVVGQGPLHISTHELTLDTTVQMMTQLLTAEALASLEELGAVEHRLPDVGDDRFNVVAARGGDDIWIEIRRRRHQSDAAVAAAQHTERQAVGVAADEERRRAAEAAVVAEAAAAEEERRLAAEAAAAEEERRRAAEAAAAEEERRRAAEAAAAEEERRRAAEAAAAEEDRRRAEAAAEEERRLAAEAAAAEEERRRAAEAAAAEEERRRAAEAAAAEEERRRAAEAAEVAAAEEERCRAEAAAEEERRLAAEAAAAEEERRQAAEAAAAEEERRRAAEAAAAEDERRRAAEAAAAEEERRLAARAAAEEEQRLAAEAAAAEEERRRAAEAAAAEEERRLAAEVAAEEERRLAAQAAAAEEVRRLAEEAAAADEERRRLAEAAAAEEERRLAAQADTPTVGTIEIVEEQVVVEAPIEAVAAPGEQAPLSVVLPMTRTVRIEVPPRVAASRTTDIERLLRIASARGASALFLTSESRPYIRVDGDIRQLEGEALLSRSDVEAAIVEIAPEKGREQFGKGEVAEWLKEYPELGRIRCTTFNDHRGPGLLLRMIATRAATAEQLGLSHEVQALATESQGLVLVAGPRFGGKSTLLSALVDLVNRQRAEFIITLERQIRLVHDNKAALVSQREIRGGADEALAAAHSALREGPDLLVIDDLISPQMVPLILTAASEGLLVFVSMGAPSTSDAVQRFVELAPPETRSAVLTEMTEQFRGAIGQVLLKKTGGGLVAAREVLLATAQVSRVISDGQLAQLPHVLEGGRKHGMVSFSDTLLDYVRSGMVDVREAFRKAPDRERLLAGLKREKIDTSVVERLA
jgi:twitching motility protein PilT